MAPRKKGSVEVLKEASTVIEEPDSKPKTKRKVVLVPEPQSLTQTKAKRKVVLAPDPKPKRKVVVIEDEPSLTETKPKRKVVVVKEDEPTMVEEGEPIRVSLVHKVCLQKFKHGSKNYYLDSERDKLYEYLAEKKHGKYVGRWDSLLEEIVAGEDSDIE
jgi:hypothetical protein